METQNVTLTRSPYDILKISRWADLEEIKAQYFHLVKQFNPEYFQEEFIEIRTAYDQLKDPARRAKCDVELIAGPPPYSYSDYPSLNQQPLSLFKLNQEYKATCGDTPPDQLEGESREKALHLLRGMALYHISHGHKDEAQEIWNHILAIDPNDEETQRNLAFSVWEEAIQACNHNDYAKAEEIFHELHEKGIDHGVIFQNLALVLEKQGKKDEAEQAWKESLKRYNQQLKQNPEDEYTKALVVAIHKYSGGKFLDGKSTHHEESMDSTTAGSAKELGYACIQKGNWKQAVEALERAHKENENDIDVLCQLGWAYLNTNQHHRAFHMWNVARKKAPGKRTVIDNLVRGHTIFGRRLKEQRIYNQALVQFKNALKFDPDNVELRLELADTYFKMNNFSAALAEYQRILEKEPRNKYAKQGVREAKRLGGLR